MAIFAISDLHLALGIDKPMDIFGDKWINYMEKIKISWNETVKPEDNVIIPGDISWATYLEDAYKDFEYIENLPGSKIILKGNHDYWWATTRKLNNYLAENGFKTMKFLHNNCYVIENFAICGTRGWKCPGEEDFSEEDEKIYLREIQRLNISLESYAKIASDVGEKDIIVALHFMPFNSKRESSGFIDVMKKYNVKLCIYGHLHGNGAKNAVEGEYEGMEFRLVAADYLDFKPLRIY
ncbi:MAG TPA: serine/threonine protein phosphatase [Clostridiaceae bacterium]|nr:serine/threonine protein phosphatase [Clostridiaceae bacterium]